MSAPTTAPADSRRAQSNRENARKSTGPRTPDGKSRAAQNAVTHGAFAQNLFLPHEDKEHFAQHYCSMLKSLHPTNPIQTFLAQRIIALAWRLNRLNAAESHLHFTRIAQFHENLAKIKKTQPEKKLAPEFDCFTDTENLPDGFILGYEYDKPENNNAFERLNKTEQRLSNMLHRAIRDLKSLQENPQEESAIDDPSPLAEFLIPDDPDEEGEDNDNDNDNDESSKGRLQADQDDTEGPASTPLSSPNSAQADANHSLTPHPSNSICENEAKCQSVSPPEAPTNAFSLKRLEST
jgi:hypothetical protein